MKKVFIIFLGLFLVSCGSSQIKDDRLSDEDLADLQGLTNDDFKPVRDIRYNSEADYHVIGDVVNDALKDESLAKIDPERIEEVEKNIQGVMGLCYLGKTAEGLKKLDELYPKFKKNPSFWNQMGSCYLKQGQYRKAKIFYNKSLSLDKSYVPAINNLGVIYIKEAKDQKALAAFNEVLKFKNSKTARYNLANMYIKYGQFVKAEKMLMSLKNTYPKDKDIILSLAFSRLYRGDSNAALSYMSKLDDKLLRRPGFSLALFYSYKLKKDKKARDIEKYLERVKLNKDQRAAFESIKRL